MIARALLCLCLLAVACRASALPPAWLDHVAALAEPATVTAAFTEQRHTPLKKKPVIVTGTVRIDRARGLSLAYDQARAPLVILDAEGLLLRHTDGREQIAPPEAEPDLRLLHALFALDLPTLQKAYALTHTGDPAADWILTFARLPDSTASYRELILAGTGSRLTTIILAKTANLRTEISLSAPHFAPTFSPPELTRYFRSSAKD